MNVNRDNNRNNDENPVPDNEQKPRGPYGQPGGFNNWWLLLIFFAFILLPWIIPIFSGFGQGSQISYTEFRQEVQSGNVQQVRIAGEKITGRLTDSSSENQGTEAQSFVTYIPSRADQNLLDMLQDNDVQVFTGPSPDESGDGGFGAIFNIIFFVFIGYLIYRSYKMMQNRGQGIFNFGRNQAKRIKPEKVGITFDDVAGIQSAKKELQEVVAFLKEPEKFKKYGAKTPKGLLLVGAPGTGKTLLARAVAGESGVPFFMITGSDFMEMFVGIGARRVRNLFKDAKKDEPAIIFIDELDSIGRSRGAGLGGGHDEREQTLNQLLSEMDGFEKYESVIVMAATNRPDILDQALLRPGRFDRRVEVQLPPKDDRVEVLKIHAREKPIGDDVDFDRVARNTPGFSGAELENLLNESALLAAEREHGEIKQKDIDDARDKILLGLERKSVVLTDEEKRVIAYHEGGHAIVAAALPHTDPVHKVTIIPRSKSMGVTQQMPEKDKYIYEKKYLLHRMAVMMGGRASEHLKTDTVTSGAENDLKQAQKLARKMVLDWGMSDGFKNISFGSGQEHVFLGEEIGQKREYSDETARKIDLEVRKILDNAYETAEATLKKHEKGLDQLADLLLEKEEILGEKVEEIVNTEKE